MKTCGIFLLPALVLSAFLPFALSGCGSTSPGTGSTTTPVTSTATPATVTSIAPTVIPAGSGATVITLTGTNFLSSSVVQVAGVSQSTTYVSATQLQATIPANLLGTGNLRPSPC
ncbi:MAG: conserved repeat domain protein [Acidobacteriaceae bacterium]|nr:conserved repeat domain protein [Acidobacteriaceae bacterium]